MKKNPTAAAKTSIPEPETLNAGAQTATAKSKPLEDSRVEYTELALDCLDLKAQEELLCPSFSGRKRMHL